MFNTKYTYFLVKNDEIITTNSLSPIKDLVILQGAITPVLQDMGFATSRAQRYEDIRIVINIPAVDHIEAFIHLTAYLFKCPVTQSDRNNDFFMAPHYAKLQRCTEYVIGVAPIHLGCQRHTSVTLSTGPIMLQEGEQLTLAFSCYNYAKLRLVNTGTEEEPNYQPVIDDFTLPIRTQLFYKPLPI